jgi:hypothetical protein
VEVTADDPDARLESAEPAAGPLVLAAARRKPSDARAPYHHGLDPDHEDDLLLQIGQGLALIDARERMTPQATLKAVVTYIDAVRTQKRRLTRDPTDAALALACVFGHQLGRELGWGWAHLRRARAPGIVLVAPDFRHVIRPRQLIDRAFREGASVLPELVRRLSALSRAPGRGFYAPLT